MDKIPTGGRPGGGVDGSFERFITAAIATIITIMFSWRLLSDEEEATRALGQAPPIPGAPLALPATSVSTPGYTSSLAPAPEPPPVEPEVTRTEYVDTEAVMSVQYEPQTTCDLEAIPPKADTETEAAVGAADDGHMNETLSTWDDLNWGESSDGEGESAVHTRRSVRDFITRPGLTSVNTQNRNPETHSNDPGVSPVSDTSPVSFTERFANFEYRDTGGDSGYIDLYPDVESDDSDDDSSDDEQNYDIQVSSSSGSSDGEDGNEEGESYFGVTQLDTIMEEIESGSSDTDTPRRRHSGPVQPSVLNNTDNISTFMINIDNQPEGNPPLDDSGDKQGGKVNSSINLDGNQSGSTQGQHTCNIPTRHIPVNIDRCEDCNMPEMSNTNRYTLDKSLRTAEVSRRQTHQGEQQTPINTDGSRITSEHNLMHDSTSKADDKTASDINYIHTREVMCETECNIHVDYFNLANTNTDDKASCTQTRIESNDRVASLENKYVNKSQVPEITKSAFAIELSKLQSKMRPSNLSEPQIAITTSEQSDDSLPSSPIRTRALDQLAEELHSDTESCSSESVITVLSVRSNDSGRYQAGEPTELSLDPAVPVLPTWDSINTDPYRDRTDIHAGQSSLVTSFLNDSLNSLNNAHNCYNDNDNNQTAGGPLDQITEHGTDDKCSQMNGRLSNDSLYETPSTESSSTDSLPIGDHGSGQTDGRIEVTNGNDTESADTAEYTNESEYLGRFIGSDSSSDSSDPPLREYDPADDDLAEFQFNDFDDDSFYLLVGDEGNLRNFETFTNLNSVGLSPDYGDAVTSSAVNENVTGFKFSKTEEISTKFRRRGYLTDRSNTPDSETRSDGMLSPISSEDEDRELTEHASPPASSTGVDSLEINIDNIVLPLEQSVLSTDPQILSTDTDNSKGSIDFRKYIIATEHSPLTGDIIGSKPNNSNDSVLEGGMSIYPNHCKEAVSINEGSFGNVNSHASREDIDLADEQNTVSVKTINNSECIGETLTSLTSKIQQLLQTSGSDQDSALAIDGGNYTDICTADKTDNLHSGELNEIPIQTDNSSSPGDIQLNDNICDNDADLSAVCSSTYVCDTKESFITGNTFDICGETEINNNDALSHALKQYDDSVAAVTQHNISKYINASATVNTESNDIETNINDLLSEVSNICDTVTQHNTFISESRVKSKETNVEDLFVDVTPYADTYQKPEAETLINEQAATTSSKTKRTDVNLVSKSNVETNIDDIFAESVQYLNSSTKRKHHKKETCVDDIFGDNQSTGSSSDVSAEYTQQSPRVSQRGNLETNVDDLFIDEILPVVTAEQAQFPTTIIDENSNESEITLDPRTGRVRKVKGRRRKSGRSVGGLFGDHSTNSDTNITDSSGSSKEHNSSAESFRETTNVSTYAVPIQSTPCKATVHAPSHDTINVETHRPVINASSSKSRVCIETCVDDLFNNAESEATISSPFNEQSVANVSNVNELENDASKLLTYETFVDDLFEDILTKDSCISANTQADKVAPTDSAILDHGREYSGTSLPDQGLPDPCTVGGKGTNSNTRIQRILVPQSDSCQIEQNVQNVNTIQTSDPSTDNNHDNANLCVLSGGYKAINGDVNLDKPTITESIGTSQYGGALFDKETIENHPIISTRQTNPPQLKCTLETSTDIPGRCVQNNTGNDNTYTNWPRDTAHKTTPGSTEIEPIEEFEIKSEKLIEPPITHSNELSTPNNQSETIGKQQAPTNNGNVRVTDGGNLNICYVGHEPVEFKKIDSSKVYNIHKSATTHVDLLQPETKCENIELIIVEDDENSDSLISDSEKWSSLDYTSSLCENSEISFDGSLTNIDDSFTDQQENVNNARRRRILSEPAAGRIIREHVARPSEFARSTGGGKELQGVRRRIHRHQLKKYTSILQQPVISEGISANISLPEQPTSLSRVLINKSRQKFLSAENLSSSLDERFSHFRTSFSSSTPRKYRKRHEKHFNELQSTESLPTDMSSMNASFDSYSSMDRLHAAPYLRRVDDVNVSRYSSANTSYERPDIDKIHANCIFTPRKQKELQEIRHSTKSLENMFEQLLKYGSVSSLAETDLDSGASSQPGFAIGDHTDISDFVSLQYPLERAASMSALTATSGGHHLPRKPGHGRFSGRHVAKSKSLQTLETNLDDVFPNEDEFSGELKKTPSVHELRVAKSLTKLSVPDWFKKSSFSRSDSTQSLFTYAGRQGSTSTLGSSAYPCSITTSPSPSVTPGSHTVIIQKRVTPSPTSPSARLVRAPMLPVTPEMAPIHPILPENAGLPSDKYRSREKKSLKPIAIVSFAKLREMFERKSTLSFQMKQKKTPRDDRAGKHGRTPVTEQEPVSPTKEKQSKVRFESMPPTRDEMRVLEPMPPVRETVIDSPRSRDIAPTRLHEPRSPTKETVIDAPYQPLQNHRETVSPPPPIPERKRIIVERGRSDPEYTQQNGQTRRTQVHFSDENTVSKSQEQNANPVRYASKKPQSLRASLPMPQFRFRRPGSVLKAQMQAAQSTQNKKGKENINLHDPSEWVDPFRSSLHALEIRAQSDGEHLFEFLQKRRYSSLLENGFAEQMDDLQDRDVTFTFPVMAVGKHSKSGYPLDGSSELHVALTNACINQLTNGEQRDNGDTPSLEDVLDGLLAMDGDRRPPKLSDDDPSSPESVHGITITPPGHVDAVFIDANGSDVNVYDVEADYVLVRCTNENCKRETNLKEAKKFYKTCHNCYTYYCSRTCRKENWETHKTLCIYSRINSACKHAIKAINRSPQLQYHCSRLARRGYLSQGRGCVVLAFPDIDSSEEFLYYGMESLWVPPVYVSVKELPYASMFGAKLDLLTETCKQYNPELKYVIHVAVVIPPKLPAHPIPRRAESIIQKCAKLRLSPAHMHPKQEEPEVPSTMILTAVPRNSMTGEVDDLKARELCFINIQRKLRHRGVSLRHQFPHVYNKLIDFVSDAKHFSPLIIYPVDRRTGKKFMCVIMPESEPEIEWIRDPDIFQELDVFDEDECQLSILSTSLPDFSTSFPDFPVSS